MGPVIDVLIIDAGSGRRRGGQAEEDGVPEKEMKGARGRHQEVVSLTEMRFKDTVRENASDKKQQQQKTEEAETAQQRTHVSSREVQRVQQQNILTSLPASGGCRLRLCSAGMSRM